MFLLRRNFSFYGTDAGSGLKVKQSLSFDLLCPKNIKPLFVFIIVCSVQRKWRAESPYCPKRSVVHSYPRVGKQEGVKVKLKHNFRVLFWTQCNVLLSMLPVAVAHFRTKKMQEVSQSYTLVSWISRQPWLTSRCLPRCLHVHFDRPDCNCTSRCAIESDARRYPIKNRSKAPETGPVTNTLHNSEMRRLRPVWRLTVWCHQGWRNTSFDVEALLRLLKEFAHRVWTRPDKCTFKLSAQTIKSSRLLFFPVPSLSFQSIAKLTST